MFQSAPTIQTIPTTIGQFGLSTTFAFTLFNSSNTVPANSLITIQTFETRNASAALNFTFGGGGTQTLIGGGGPVSFNGTDAYSTQWKVYSTTGFASGTPCSINASATWTANSVCLVWFTPPLSRYLGYNVINQATVDYRVTPTAYLANYPFGGSNNVVVQSGERKNVQCLVAGGNANNASLYALGFWSQQARPLPGISNSGWQLYFGGGLSTTRCFVIQGYYPEVWPNDVGVLYAMNGVSNSVIVVHKFGTA